MAGSTTNIGLIKPTYSEDADVAIINENMDTLDSTISALDNGLAIVSNNNTHGAITAGQYVYVRNHGSLAEGMYTANSNIAANATLSSSNLTAVTGGGLNDLAGDISALNGNVNSKIGSLKIFSDTGNKTTYSFTIGSENRFRLGLVLYSTGSANTAGYLGLLFINASNEPTVTKIWGGTNPVTITPAFSNGVLTITTSSTLYGGIRVIFLD